MARRYTHTIDPAALRTVAPSLTVAQSKARARELGTAMHRFQPRIGHRAAAHFIAQTCHESGEYRWTREIWGPTAVQAGYWRRRDIQGPGPLWPALGYLTRGGGYIQTTGRANFRSAAAELGRKSFLLLAKRSGNRRMSALLAMVWWSAHFPRAMPAREWDVDRVTRRVNGGTNGLAERRKYTARAMRVRRKLVPKPIPIRSGR